MEGVRAVRQSGRLPGALGLLDSRTFDALKPSAQGKRVAFDGLRRTVIDGPFTETKELIAGFWLWEVKDMDEAVA
ncbi:MAG: YciI family protein [Burkholderiales bacterium]|nr:YciI family protein [Burkholderiales bacterium]